MCVCVCVRARALSLSPLRLRHLWLFNQPSPSSLTAVMASDFVVQKHDADRASYINIQVFTYIRARPEQSEAGTMYGHRSIYLCMDIEVFTHDTQGGYTIYKYRSIYPQQSEAGILHIDLEVFTYNRARRAYCVSICLYLPTTERGEHNVYRYTCIYLQQSKAGIPQRRFHIRSARRLESTGGERGVHFFDQYIFF